MSDTPAIPVIEAGGARIPQIGLGTWKVHGEALAGSIEAAVASGYRHFDTAAFYDNEPEVGAALRASALPRDDYFLTTKVWYTEGTRRRPSPRRRGQRRTAGHRRGGPAAAALAQPRGAA